jgi:hypothetical protein
MALAFGSVALGGCGHEERSGPPQSVKAQERYIAAAYSCMPTRVQREYRHRFGQFERVFKETVKRHYGDLGVDTLNAALTPYRVRLVPLVRRYAPPDGKPCRPSGP